MTLGPLTRISPGSPGPTGRGRGGLADGSFVAAVALQPNWSPAVRRPPDFVHTRAGTLFAGTTEIMKEIIGKSLLR
ncbi:hypothetical protein [Streptomyces sp. Z423-1]|uniref:hypothetical protein n=1 Tax=Streptomyces sp. Z423-1 TaxID=2730915 RepID=UPI0014897D6C|nr:hypothetical protein [Streptomyces sp. Z423-1]